VSSYDFDKAMLSKKELKLLITTPPKECFICDLIVNSALFKDIEGNYWVMVDDLDNSDIEHLEQVIGRKVIDGVTDCIIAHGRYTSNQS